MKDNKKEEMRDKRQEMVDAVCEVRDRFGAPAAREIIYKHGFAEKLVNVPSECYNDVITACRAKLSKIKMPTPKDKPGNIADPYEVVAEAVKGGEHSSAQKAFAVPYGGRPEGDNTMHQLNRKHVQADKIDHHHESMAAYHIGLPGDLLTTSTALVLDTANLMGQKLMAKQEEFGDSWRQVDWQHDGRRVEGESLCRHYMFQHMLKGDPVDVANFAAFLAYHGWSSAPQEREEAALLVKALQEKFDLIDDATNTRQLMDIMEERHGQEFERFFEATIMQVMQGSGMSQVIIDTNLVAANMLTGARLVCREEQDKLIYEFAQDVEPDVEPEQPEERKDD